MSAHRYDSMIHVRIPRVKLIVLLVFVLLLIVMTFTVGNWPLPKLQVPPPADAVNTVNKLDPVHAQTISKMAEVTANDPIPFLDPWGDDRLGVFREWVLIYRIIRGDISTQLKNKMNSDPKMRFQAMVYDTHDGYLTLSLAKYVPELFVTSLLFTNCGNNDFSSTLVARRKCLDINQILAVYQKQTTNLREEANQSRNINICMSPDLSKHNIVQMTKQQPLAHYQVALSVFDHLRFLPTKGVFQRALISLLMGASIETIISLPVIGDWEYSDSYYRWYDGLRDPLDVVKAAADALSVSLSIRRLAFIQWRGVNRTVLGVRLKREQTTIPDCAVRRKALRCAAAQTYLSACDT